MICHDDTAHRDVPTNKVGVDSCAPEFKQSGELEDCCPSQRRYLSASLPPFFLCNVGSLDRNDRSWLSRVFHFDGHSREGGIVVPSVIGGVLFEGEEPREADEDV